jgi:hypothetical protein
MAPVARFDVNRILDACEARGLDPAQVVSCAPSDGPQKVEGVRGCNSFGNCIFNLTRNGGFKGTLPRNIGYYLDPNDGSGHRKEDFCPCFRFMYSLGDRMKAAEFYRGQGPVETIQIVAQEGELIRVSTWVPVDPKDKSETAAYRKDKKTIPVPKFDPNMLKVEDDYERELLERQAKREEAGGQFAVGPPSARLLDADDNDEEVMPMGTSEATITTAEPEK